MSAEPRSGHELTVFVVPAHLGRTAAQAIDLFVAHTHGVNVEYAWLVVDAEVRAYRPPAADLTGALLAAHTEVPPAMPVDLTEVPPAMPVDLTEGFAMAVELGWRFLGNHDDGLPAAVDLLLVADPQCRLDADGPDGLAAEGLVQAGIVLHRHAAVMPVGVLRRDIDRLDTLGWEWLLLRERHRAHRHPDPTLG